MTSQGAVCSTCNNGWMGDLEQRAKPMFDAMLHGHGRALHRAGQRTLAAWASKMASVLERVHGAKRHMIPQEDCYHLFEHGEPSHRMLIWMAAHGGDVPAMGRMFGLDADMALDPDPDRGQRAIGAPRSRSGPSVLQLFGSTIPELLEGVVTDTTDTHLIWPFQQSCQVHARALVHRPRARRVRRRPPQRAAATLRRIEHLRTGARGD